LLCVTNLEASYLTMIDIDTKLVESLKKPLLRVIQPLVGRHLVDLDDPPAVLKCYS